MLQILLCNPINAQVPIETPANKVMILGAYPSAKFYTVYKFADNTSGIADTPLYDNDSPFSNESYFDGSQTRTIPSGQELNEVILKNIGVIRQDCWITDLVKVFLFKQGHIDRYNKLGKTDMIENRTMYDGYAKESIKWLEMEVEIANPYVVILLGIEVTSSIFDIPQNKAKEYLDGHSRETFIGSQSVNVIALPNPGILMKHSKNNPWLEKFINVIAPVVKQEIIKLRKAVES